MAGKGAVDGAGGGARMLRASVLSLLLLAPAPAQAFSQCTVTPLTGPNGEIAEEGSNPVAWKKWVYAGFIHNQKIGIAVSPDAGKTLAAPVILDTETSPHHIRLAASGAAVYATWRAKFKDGWHILFDASRANGAAGSWDKPKDLGPLSPQLTQIAASEGFVYIAYLGTDGNVALRTSADHGRTFSAPVPIAAGWGEIVVAALKKHVYVAWQLKVSRSRFEVFAAASGDAGATFKVTDLSAGRPAGSVEPILSIDQESGRVSLVWRDQDTAQTGYYVRSTDGGRAWSAPVVVDSSARQFMVADAGSIIYVSYLTKVIVGGVPDWQVEIATSSDGGDSFPAKQNLSGKTGINDIEQDDFRPIPWIRGSLFRITGMRADGVYMWSGNDGRFGKSAYLGPGDLAAPALDSAVWMDASGAVDYGVCR